MCLVMAVNMLGGESKLEHHREEPRMAEKLGVSGEEAVVIAMSTSAAGVGAENGTSMDEDRPTHARRSHTSRRKRAARRCALLFCPAWTCSLSAGRLVYFRIALFCLVSCARKAEKVGD